MLMMGLSFAWGWRYLSAHPELVAKQARPAFPAGARRALLGGLVYLLAIAVAFLSPTASFAIDAIVAVYFAASRSRVPGSIVRSAHKPVPARPAACRAGWVQGYRVSVARAGSGCGGPAGSHSPAEWA